METRVRSKEEVIRDIEATRRQVKPVVTDTKEAFTERNAVAQFWRSTKDKASQARTATRHAAFRTKMKVVQAKEKVVSAAATTDQTIRSNIYTSIGVAACVGTAIGYLVTRRLKAKRKALKALCS